MMLVPTLILLVCNWYATFYPACIIKKCVCVTGNAHNWTNWYEKFVQFYDTFVQMLCCLCATTIKKTVSGEKLTKYFH